jgi:hypothetical protein
MQQRSGGKKVRHRKLKPYFSQGRVADVDGGAIVS